MAGMNIWKALATGGVGGASEYAINQVLDLVLENTAAELLLDSIIIANNSSKVCKNLNGSFAANTDPAMTAIYSAVQTGSHYVTQLPVVDKLLRATLEPNITGIPISSASVETDREIEVSESQVIVQSKRVKQYWTDNAVPRLKTWTIQGYLTSASPLDSGQLIKPTLIWQAFYLDVCAKSRRPVIFKTNRGEFEKVQITSLHTSEEASYNNAIKVEISLKEYNPYFIKSDLGNTVVAVKQGA